MSSGFVRVLKAEEPAEEPAEEKAEEPAISEQEMHKRVTAGEKALAEHFRQTLENPPLNEEGELDFDELYHEIIYANNTMFADLMGLSDDERYQEVVNAQDEVITPSIMSAPMITRPILNALKVFEESDEAFAPLKQIREADEKENGSLKDYIKRNRIRDDFSKWVADAKGTFSADAKQNILDYLQNKTSHPIGASLSNISRIQGGYKPKTGKVRVVPHMGSGVDSDFGEQMDELTAQGRKNLGDIKDTPNWADWRTSSQDKSSRAKAVYDEVFGELDDYQRGQQNIAHFKVSTPQMKQWEQLINTKMNTKNLEDVKQAIPLVQDDFNNYMKGLLQTDAIGSSGKSKHFGGAPIAGKAPDIVSPSFYHVARQMGVKITAPNCSDAIGKFFVNGTPINNKIRNEIADNIVGGEGEGDAKFLHSALHQAMSDEGVLHTVREEHRNIASIDMADAGGSIEERQARVAGGGAVGSNVSDARMDDEKSIARLKEATLQDRTKKRSDMQAVEIRDLEHRVKYEGMSKYEFEHHKNMILADDKYHAHYTTEHELPKGEDFPVGHPYRDLSQEEIIEKSKRFMDLLVGNARTITDVNHQLRLEGMSQKDIEKLNLGPEDVTNMAKILNTEQDNMIAFMNTFSDKNIRRYEKAFESGISKGYLNNLNHQISDLRGKIQDAGFNPADVADAAMTYSNHGMSQQGYEMAFQNMLARAKDGGSNMWPLFMALRAAQKVNDATAESIARLEESKGQQDRFSQHHIMRSKIDKLGNEEPDEDLSEERRAKIIKEKEDCLGCSPEHFMTRTAEDARKHAQGLGHIDKSAFKHREVSVPNIMAPLFDPQTNEEKPLYLFSEGGNDICEISNYLFGGDDSYDEHKAGLEKSMKNMGKNEYQMKKHIQKQIKQATLDGNRRIDGLANQFGIRNKIERILPTGAASLSPHARQALGHVLPNNFMSDAGREKLRMRGLVGTQMSGLVEALELMQGMKNGEVRMGEKGRKFPMKSMKGYNTRKDSVKDMYGTSSISSRNRVKKKSYDLLSSFLRDTREHYTGHDGLGGVLGDWEDKYGSQMGDVTDPEGNGKEKMMGKYHVHRIGEDGHAQLNDERRAIEDEHSGEILMGLQTLKEMRSPILGMSKNSNIIKIPKEQYHLIGFKGSDHIEISNDDGNETAEIWEVLPPRRKADTHYTIKLKEPLKGEYHAEDGESEGGQQHFAAQIQNITPKKKPNIFRKFKWLENRLNEGASAQDIHKEIDRNVKRAEEGSELSKRETDRQNARRNSIAYGAFLKAGDKILPLLDEEDEGKLMDGLEEIRQDLYTDSDGMPIPDIFRADAKGEINRDFTYRADKYLVGQRGSSGGTGLSHHWNHIHLPQLTDDTIMRLVRDKHGLKSMTEEEENAHDDSARIEVSSEYVANALRKLNGDDYEEEKPPEVAPPVLEQDDGLISEKEARRLGINSHFSPEVVDAWKEGSTKRLKSNWNHDGPTACGVCAGHSWLPMSEAINYLAVHKKELQNVHHNSEKMNRATHKYLRPRNDGDDDVTTWEEHELHGEIEPHEHTQVACPACEETNLPHVRGGKCSSGICSNCVGHGVRDPEDDAYIQDGYTFIDENGNKHKVQGKKDHPIEGSSPPIDNFNIPSTSNVLGTSPLGLDLFNESVDRGLIAPVTNIEQIKARNKKRYATKEHQSLSDLLNLDDDEEDAPGGLRNITYEQGKNPFAIAIDNSELNTGKEKDKALLDDYNRHQITTHINHLADKAIANGESEKGVNGIRNHIINHPDLLGIDGNDEHKLYKMIHLLQNLHNKKHTLPTAQTSHYDPNENYEKVYTPDPQNQQFQQFRTDIQGNLDAGNAFHGGVNVARSRDFQNRVFGNGRWQSEAEQQEGIFKPGSNSKPHVRDAEIMRLFAHSPEMIEAWIRHTQKGDFNQEDGDNVVKVLKGIENPLREKQIKDMVHPKLKELIDNDFKKAVVQPKAGHIQGLEGHIKNSMDEPQLTWSHDVIEQLPKKKAHLKSYMGVENHNPTHHDKGPTKSIDRDYNDEMKKMVKAQMREYVRMRALQHLFEHYDSIENPGLTSQLSQLEQAEGHERLSADNFMKKTMGNAHLNNLMWNSAAELIGFVDEKDMNENINLTKTITIGDETITGKEFKEECLRDAPSKGENTGGSVYKIKPVPLPLPAEEMLQYNAQFAAGDERDSNTANDMQLATMAEKYPNYSFEAARNDIYEKYGYKDSKEVTEASKNGTLDPNCMLELTNHISKIKSVVPDYQPIPQHDLETHDAVRQREQNLAPDQLEWQRHQKEQDAVNRQWRTAQGIGPIPEGAQALQLPPPPSPVADSYPIEQGGGFTFDQPDSQ